jgi:hypothetical protein
MIHLFLPSGEFQQTASRAAAILLEDEEDEGDGEYSETDDAVLVFKRRPTIL